MNGHFEPLDSHTIATTWLSRYSTSLTSHSVPEIVSTFLPHGWLRDILIFTWNFRSLEGRLKIASYLTDNLTNKNITNVELEESSEYLKPRSFDAAPFGETGVEVSFTFQTQIASGRGLARLLPDDKSEWNALSVLMMMDDLKGYEETGPDLGLHGHPAIPWIEIHSKQKTKIERDPYVIILGAGQTGLQIAARFQQMNIPSLVIEKNSRVGDNWRKRYPSLYLHTPRTHHSLLYQPYPPTWPQFTPRDKVAQWQEQYAITQDLTIWTNSFILPTPTYDSDTKRWIVIINRDGKNVELKPAHIVVATGTLGSPNVPVSLDGFEGEAFHAVRYNGGEPYAGKRVVVVGSGNTSADICRDLVLNKARSVTMIQRSTSCVVSIHTNASDLSVIWPEGTPVEVSDFKHTSMPWGLLKKVCIDQHEVRVRKDAKLREDLGKAGFGFNDGLEDGGPLLNVVERFGGHWVDVGCAALLASGQVGLKQGVEVARLEGNKVIFTDGSDIETDVVIFGTGYKSSRDDMKVLFGASVIDQTSPVWGADEEGEIRGCYRPSGHPGLWYAAGDFFYSRYFSKHLALQIKATEIGLVR